MPNAARLTDAVDGTTAGEHSGHVPPHSPEPFPVKYPSSLFIAPTIRAISRATLGFSANMVIMSFSVFLFVDTFVFNGDETGHGIVCGICAQGGEANQGDNQAVERKRWHHRGDRLRP